MNLPSVTWTVLIVLYALFTSWYTSCAGPLTPEEIETQLGAMKARGADAADIAQIREFLESDTGDDFVMVNVIEMREPPTQIEGVAPGDTASDVLDKYMEYMYPALFSRACHPVFFGQATAAALDVWGIEGAERWTTAAGMRYRSRRDMLEIASTPDFQGPHEFKLAAMNKTIAFPVDPWFHLGDPRLVLALLGLVIGLVVHGFEGHRRARRRTAATAD